MSAHRYRFFVLLSALLVLLGFFFPLYSSLLLSPSLARGPLDQSASATAHFLLLVGNPQYQRQIQAISLFISLLCFLFYWLLLLLALLSLSFSVWAFRSSSSITRNGPIWFARLGLVVLGLLLLCHTLSFVGAVLAFTQRKDLTLWKLLQLAGTPLFWRTLWLFCTSSSFGIWLPLLGFLTPSGLHWFLPPSERLRHTSNH
ncbi:MAG: hypothetical protein J2P36_03200 [Ktedonobacteraceae bacterium]|nr:hypothetical protein [Ktedonobacteraceae bacterium]